MAEKPSLSDVFTSNLGEQNLKRIFGRDEINEINAIYKIEDIELDKIHANPNQPRKLFDQGKLQELAESIRLHGLFTPILLNRDGKDKFLIIAGERRYRATKLLGNKTIKAIICNLSTQAISELSLLENIQRENLNPLEEARAYKQLISKYDYTQESLAKRVGKSREYIANLLRLLKLPEDIQKALSDNVISAGHARALLSLSNEQMTELKTQIITNHLSVRETENLVKQKKKADKYQLPYEELVMRLENKLGRKISVSKTKLSFTFENDEDLKVLLETLNKNAD